MTLIARRLQLCFTPFETWEERENLGSDWSLLFCCYYYRFVSWLIVLLHNSNVECVCVCLHMYLWLCLCFISMYIFQATTRPLPSGFTFQRTHTRTHERAANACLCCANIILERDTECHRQTLPRSLTYGRRGKTEHTSFFLLLNFS